MIRAAAAGQLVNDRPHVALLHIFLKHSLVVFDEPSGHRVHHAPVDEPHDELLCDLHASVNVQSADHRFHRVRKDGRLLPAAGVILPAAKKEQRAKVIVPRHLVQRALADRLRPEACHRTLIVFRKAQIQVLARAEFQHGIAEELQTLVVRACTPVPFYIGSMRKRSIQQRQVMEPVCKPFLQRIKHFSSLKFQIILHMPKTRIGDAGISEPSVISSRT